MLDQTTKRKLDSARQILVGKVPDPKAQVEQITTALVYKFMDDMDKESEELGGKAKFFANGFSQYAWTKLLDNKLSGQERLDLYVQAITNMPKNPHIPQLFRDIFKGAFLPYNDPRTLSLFLKEINEFNYEHSENLGNAFEYLLSILGSQGDAGQFRTPRHIIDFIVEVVDPKKDESILDPACGTAGFLISAYKHILKQNKEKTLTPDEKLKLMNNLAGYDISPDMVKLALVNMYLHGFPEPKIHEYDTLSSEKRWDETFDVIMANPPFMTPKGGIVPHKRFSIQANRAEVLFVDYIVEHLTIKGRAGIIVPEGVIFQSNNAYTQLRKKLVEDGLFAVVSLPAGVFNPYAGVKTSILLFDNEISKKTKNFLFVKIQNDGFDLGAQRREHNKNDLPFALEIIKKYKSVLNDKDFEFNEDEKQIAHFVAKEKIIATGDYNLSGDRYKESFALINQKWPLVELGKVCEIYQPKTITSKEIKSEGKYKVFGANGVIGYYDKYNHEDSEVLITCRGATCGTLNLSEPKSWITGNAMVVKPKNNLDKKFLFYFLKNINLKNTISGSAQPQITRTSLSPFKIPLPPLEVQKVVIEQIEKYQNIINGAKQIISNYGPTIKVDSSWQIIELGNLFLDTKLGLVKDKSMQADIFPYPYIKMENISMDGNLELNSVVHVEASKEELEKYTLNDGDFIYNTRNAPNLVGKSTVYHGENGKYLFNNNILRIRFRKEADPDYINYYLNTEEGKQKIKTLVSGTTSVAAIYQKNFATITVPLPSIKVQKEIVAEISKEKECIIASAKTIDIFEKKISELINDIL
ncbi:MAG: methyltransferase domain-containing protein [Sphingobacteriia bacterium]|jgi:type I restriction enzyme M protein|nr:methyltransferase domain-containing protein [Sphingobacteriia bacterium]